MTHLALRPAALAGLALAAAACGKQTFLAAALLQTPQVQNPVVPSQPIPSQTLLTAYLGTIDTSNPAKIDRSKVQGVTGASASIAFHSALRNSDEDLPVKDAGQGAYTLDSVSQPKLTYEQGQQYTLVLIGGDDKQAYGAKLLPAPPAQINEFHPEQVKPWQANQPFTITRGDPPASDGRLLPAFITVVKVDPQTGQIDSTPTYTTLPTSATALLKFALDDKAYRFQTAQVPGSAFPGKGYFIVTLLVARYGLVSENTFVGSTAITGTGDAGLLVIQ